MNVYIMLMLAGTVAMPCSTASTWYQNWQFQDAEPFGYAAKLVRDHAFLEKEIIGGGANGGMGSTIEGCEPLADEKGK